MELTAARRILGVAAADDWSVVREAYRTIIRTTHPDIAGDAGTDRAIEVNAAYRTLALARREGRLHDMGRPDPRPGGASATRPRPRARPREVDDHRVPDDVRLLGDDTIVLASTPGESFRRLVEATHLLGDISYIDRSSAIFEAVLALDDDTHASFVVSFQWRAHDATCEAFCTLEALDRAEHLDVRGVLGQLLPLIPPDRDAAFG